MPDPKPTSEYYNFKPLRYLFVTIFLLVFIFWKGFKTLPLNIFTHASAIWILHLYRCLNKDQTSVQNEFFISFWVRMGWALCYSLLRNGHLFTDREVFAKNLIEWFIATGICTGIPLRFIEKAWSNRIYRWLIFIIDQPFANGYSFLNLYKTEFIHNYSSLGTSLAIMISKAISRPACQIITGHFNKNLRGKNLIKWATICYLNACRVMTLCIVNYIALMFIDESSEQWLQYFNVLYYGGVGYLMYLETYTL